MSDIVYGIRLQGDATSAKRAFDETRGAQDKLTDAGRKNSRAAVDLARANEQQVASLNRMRLAALAAGVAIVAMLRSTITAAVEAERSIARLNAVWRATGGTSGLSIAQHEALAQRMAIETRFDDEQIRDAMAQLATFRQVSGDTFIETMNIAASLAEVMQTDLKGAILQLGKALEDPVRGMSQLREVGVSFGPAQESVIKNLVETGRQAEAMTMILRILKEQGFDEAAQAMNQGIARATSDLSKEWSELLEAFSSTKEGKGVVTESLGLIRDSLWAIRNVIEGGSWVDSFKQIILLDKPSNRLPIADASSTEATAARRAAQQTQWETAFNAQQAQAREFLKKRDEEEKKASKERADWLASDQARADAQFAASYQRRQDILDKNNLQGVEFLQLEDQKRLALEKEAEAVSDAVNPWNAYAREVERLRDLMEKGLITHSEFTAAVALQARQVAGSFDEMADKGTQSFEELKDAIEGWGQDLSRELARGEVGIHSFMRLFEELLAIQIQRRFMQPFLSAGTDFLSGLFNTSGVASASQMDAFQAAGAYTGNAAPFHAGGIVGLEGGPRRYVHPGYFENAPRLHAGGLADGEVPAILRRGEGVFTPEQMRAMGGMPSVRVEVINNGMPVTARQDGAPRFDGKQLVARLVLDAAATDAGFRTQLGGYLTKPQH